MIRLLFTFILFTNILIIFFLMILYNIFFLNTDNIISLVIPSVYLTFHKCRKRLITMINNSYLKPSEVIIVISESKIEKIQYGYENEIRFIYYYRNGKHNQADNRNAGIKLAKGKYISLFDSDDYMSKYRLKIIHKLFSINSSIDVILHSFTDKIEYLYEKNILNYDIYNIMYNFSSSDIYNSYINSNISSIYKKYCCRFLNDSMKIHNAWISAKSIVLKKNKYNESWRFYRVEDTELNYRLIMNKYKFVLIKLNLGYYIHNNKC